MTKHQVTTTCTDQTGEEIEKEWVVGRGKTRTVLKIPRPRGKSISRRKK